MELLRAASPLVEPLSLDEAFVDLAAAGLPDLEVATVTRVRRASCARGSHEVTGGLTASVGHRHVEVHRQGRQRPRQARRPGRRRRPAPSGTCCARCTSP